jgi:hypothetical protein
MYEERFLKLLDVATHVFILILRNTHYLTIREITLKCMHISMKPGPNLNGPDMADIERFFEANYRRNKRAAGPVSSIRDLRRSASSLIE